MPLRLSLFCTSVLCLLMDSNFATLKHNLLHWLNQQQVVVVLLHHHCCFVWLVCLRTRSLPAIQWVEWLFSLQHACFTKCARSLNMTSWVYICHTVGKGSMSPNWSDFDKVVEKGKHPVAGLDMQTRDRWCECRRQRLMALRTRNQNKKVLCCKMESHISSWHCSYRS